MRIMFRYKLNENTKFDNQSIANVKLSKNWMCTYNKQIILEPFIRTKSNPTGIVDYEELDLDQNNKVVKSSYDIFKKKVKKYTREQLGIMTRSELVRIAEDMYELNTFGWNDTLLAKRIIEEQAKYKEVVNVKRKRSKKNNEAVSSEQTPVESIS